MSIPARFAALMAFFAGLFGRKQKKEPDLPRQRVRASVEPYAGPPRNRHERRVYGRKMRRLLAARARLGLVAPEKRKGGTAAASIHAARRAGAITPQQARTLLDALESVPVSA